MAIATWGNDILYQKCLNTLLYRVVRSWRFTFFRWLVSVISADRSWMSLHQQVISFSLRAKLYAWHLMGTKDDRKRCIKVVLILLSRPTKSIDLTSCNYSIFLSHVYFCFLKTKGTQSGLTIFFFNTLQCVDFYHVMVLWMLTYKHTIPGVCPFHPVRLCIPFILPFYLPLKPNTVLGQPTALLIVLLILSVC